MNKTKLDYLKYLNEDLSELGYYDALRDFEYMSDNYKSYDRYKISFTGYYFQRKLGNMLKKNDPIAFNVGYNEWKYEE